MIKEQSGILRTLDLVGLLSLVVLYSLHTWFNDLNRKVKFMFVTDFRKTFDTNNYGLLVKVLESLSNGNPLFTWVDSYLTNRKQFVMVFFLFKHGLCMLKNLFNILLLLDIVFNKNV